MSKNKKSSEDSADQVLELYWGVIGDPISQQLKEQGIVLEQSTMKYFDKLKEACNALTFVVPESISKKNYEKANKYVIDKIEKFFKEKQINKNNKE